MAASCALASSASGSAFVLDAGTDLQAYQLRAYRDTDAPAPILLPRYRMVETLRLDAFELLPREDLRFESNLRAYADLGVSLSDAAKVDSLRAHGVDLLLATLTYRRPRLEVRLGRQVHADAVGVMELDGLSARYVTPIGLGLEAYGGLWVKGASLFASSVYQPDGTRETDARRLALGAPGADPSLDDLEPVYGVRLVAEDLSGVSGALGYRKALVAGKTDLERASLELRWGTPVGFSAAAATDFDLLLLRLSRLRAELRYSGALAGAAVEVLRLEPLFSADSIWYYFAAAPRDEASLRADLTPPGPVRLYARASATRFNLALNTTTAGFPDGTRLSTVVLADPSLPSGVVLGASGGAALVAGGVRASLDATFRQGYSGSQLWGDATAGWRSPDQGLSFDGRFSVAQVEDGFNPLLKGIFYGGQLWATWKLNDGLRLSAMLEENVSPFARSDTRVFALVDLRAVP